MKEKKQFGLLKIIEEDVAFIMCKSFKYFSAIIKGAYCNKCKSTHTSKIVNYKIFLDSTNDVLIDGYCDKCNHEILRTIETGEKEEASERAAITRLVKVDLLGQKV